MIEINAGDRVRHKTEIVGNGLLMDVLEIADKKALCMYVDRKGPALVQDWFEIIDLEIVDEMDGGFFSMS